MARRERFELPWLTPPAFKAGAIPDFAISAWAGRGDFLS